MAQKIKNRHGEHWDAPCCWGGTRHSLGGARSWAKHVAKSIPQGASHPFPGSVPIRVFAQHLPCLLPGTTPAPRRFWGLSGRPRVLGGGPGGTPREPRVAPSLPCPRSPRCLSQLLLESKTEMKAVNQRSSAGWPLSRTSPLISSLIRLSAKTRGFLQGWDHVLLAATRLGLHCRCRGSEATPGLAAGAL